MQRSTASVWELKQLIHSPLLTKDALKGVLLCCCFFVARTGEKIQHLHATNCNIYSSHSLTAPCVSESVIILWKVANSPKLAIAVSPPQGCMSSCLLKVVMKALFMIPSHSAATARAPPASKTNRSFFYDCQIFGMYINVSLRCRSSRKLLVSCAAYPHLLLLHAVRHTPSRPTLFTPDLMPWNSSTSSSLCLSETTSR